MISQRRVGAPIMIGLAVVSLAGTALGAPGRRARAAAVSSSELVTVATVNGQPITRKQVVDEVFANQMAQLAVTDKKFEQIKFRRDVAGSIGALVMNKMQANGGGPVTVSRADVVNWLFTDKPAILWQTVESMIRERLVDQEAKKKGVIAPETEVRSKMAQAINGVRQRTQMDKKTDAQVVAAVGSRMDIVRRGIQHQILLEKLTEHEIEGKVGHKIDKDDFVDASHILIRVVGTDQKNWEAAEKKIKDIREEITTKKISFEEAAKKYSDDGSKLQQGALGVFMRGQMVPEFEKVAFTQEPNVVSEPVKSQFGYHLIKVNRKGKDTTAPERARVLETAINQRMQAYMMEIKSKGKIINSVPGPEMENPNVMRPQRG